MVEKEDQLEFNNYEEDEDEELNDTNYTPQKDALLFAIEINQSMLYSQSNNTISPAIAAVKCALQVMQQQIISRPNDMIGVLLFGTKGSEFFGREDNYPGCEFPHCCILVELKIPSSNDVKLLKDITFGEQEAQDKLIPKKMIDVSIADMLCFANQIFTIRASNFSSRRLFIITDRDDPSPNDGTMRSQAAVRARELYDMGVAVELFPISYAEHNFDQTKFYNNILYHDLIMKQENDPGKMPLFSSKVKIYGDEEGISRLSQLISDVNSIQMDNQAVFSGLPFEIGPGFQISVNGYNLLRKQKPAQSKWIYDTGEELKIATAQTSLVTDDTGIPVDRTEILPAYKFGGSLIYFSPADNKNLRFFESPILRVIGFKSRNNLPFWASSGKSTFIYPNEENCIGSTRVYSALWTKLLNDRKVGIAWYIPRSNSTPTIVAILPSHEIPANSTSKYTIPAGLWLYPLPFSDDLRCLPSLPPPLVAPDILVDQTRTVIQQLQLPGGVYDPSRYPNPALQWHYHVLNAIATEDEISVCKTEDKTIPRYRQIEKRAGCYMRKWKTILEEQIRAWQKEEYSSIGGTGIEKAHKQPRTLKIGSGPKRKKVKIESS